MYAIHDQSNILCILEGCGQKESRVKRKAKQDRNDFIIMVTVRSRGILIAAGRRFELPRLCLRTRHLENGGKDFLEIWYSGVC